jgi:hypothetical protein
VDKRAFFFFLWFYPTHQQVLDFLLIRT